MIAWLRAQPLDLRELDAKIAATLRAERLAQLGTLQRLAGARQAARARCTGSTTSSPAASRSSSSPATRGPATRCSSASPTRRTCSAPTTSRRASAAVRAFQEPDGPQLIVCATRVAAQGITLTRASNVVLPRARVDAGDARPGRGPLPPDRPARRGHRLVPARRRDDRRDDGAADRSASARTSSAVTEGRALDGEALVDERRPRAARRRARSATCGRSHERVGERSPPSRTSRSAAT